jgi:hypothetical protein
VTGTHILGAPYRGTVTDVRPHGWEPTFVEFSITFDRPTALRMGDVREFILVTVDTTLSEPGIWRDGEGSEINILP